MGYIRDLRVTIGDMITNFGLRKPNGRNPYPLIQIVESGIDRTLGVRFPSFVTADQKDNWYNIQFNVARLIRQLEGLCGYEVLVVRADGEGVDSGLLLVVRKIEDVDLSV